MKSTLLLLLNVIAPLFALSQKVTVTTLEDFKDFFYVKVVWADENGFCIISDKKPGDALKMPHVISCFDTSGKLTYTSEKFRTEYTSSSFNSLVLGRTIMYMSDLRPDYGHVKYIIEYSFNPTKKLDDKRVEIFDILTDKEEDKLNKSRYAFRTYKGGFGRKAMLTYNNDYKEPYKEGFLYRTINEKMELSPVDTFQFPYSDRLCNIDDVLYDDLNDKIYILTELFVSDGKRKENMIVM